MSFLLTVGGALLALFVLSYIRGGRFGTVVLAFGVGYLLAQTWTEVLISHFMISLPGLPTKDILYSAIVVAPGLLALLFSPKQSSFIPRIAQAFIVALLGITLLLPVLALGGSPVSELYNAVSQNRDGVIAAILCLGLADIVLSRSEKASKHNKH